MKKALFNILYFLIVCIFFLNLIGCSGCRKQKHTHDYSIKNADLSYLHNTATCTNKESYYYSCACGEKGSKTFEVGALASHSYIISVVEPTCLEYGYTTHTCQSCGYSYTDNPVEATGHDFLLKKTDTSYLKSPASCTSKAVYYYSCACGEKGDETFESGYALPHSYKSSITAPTCIEKGYTTYICSACSDSYISDHTNALGHNYSLVVIAPTCTTRGCTTYTCSICGDSRVDDYVDAVGHIDDGMGTCSVCGLNFAPHVHSYTEQNTDPSYLKTPSSCTIKAIYYYSCACGEKGVETFESGFALGHSYNAVVTAPTCTENGYTTYTCSVCEESQVCDYINALGHNYAVQDTSNLYLKTSATCTSEAEYYYSCSCGEKGSSTFTSGSALGHSYTSSTTAPTCTDRGYTTYTCSACEESQVRDYVNALGHNYAVKDTSNQYLKASATCTSEAEYYYSCACGEKGAETFESGSTLNHNYTSSIVAPTCDERGYTIHTCSACGDYYKDSYVDATGHDYASAVIAPTCTDHGYTNYHCSVCGTSYADNYVDALGHTDNGTGTCSVCGINTGEHVHSYTEKNTGDAYLKSAATCGTRATYYYSCACGAVGTEVFYSGSALGHNLTSVVTAPTCTKQGYTTRTCSLCDGVFKGSYVDALGHADDGSGTCTVCGAACPHTHVYNVQNTAIGYRVSEATCMNKAVYYYSCACGAWTTEETFEYGDVDPTKHGTEVEVIYEYIDGTYHVKKCICSRCNGVLLTTTQEHRPSPDNASVCRRCEGHIGMDAGEHIHSYIEKNTDAAYLKSAATCSTRPIYYYSCVCGAISTKTFGSGDALGHEFTSVVTPPTCTEKGYTTRTCSVCGGVFKGSYIPTLEHSDLGTGKCVVCGAICPHSHVYSIQNTAIGYRVSEATCTSKAVYYYSCACGAWTTEETFEYGDVDPTNHETIERVYVYVDGTYHLRTGVCAACGQTTSSIQEEHRSNGDSSTCRRCEGSIG